MRESVYESAESVPRNRAVFARLLRRWGYVLWLALICGFAAVHAVHLKADFPNHSPWFNDWAKYTDEGWYGNAAVRAHLYGDWYMPGDFNPAPAVPVWPFLEWLLFFVTGVNIEAARGLAVGFFLLDLLLSYALVRHRGPRWVALLAVTLAATSPFLYAFSRLAILEPMLMAFLLAALNLAVRLPRSRRPILGAVAVGLLYTLMLLTKTSAVFLLPAVGWAMLAALRHNRSLQWRCALAAALTSVLTFGGWIAFILHAGLLRDYNYLFFINKYEKPAEFYWPLLSFWWSLRGVLWADRVLLPLGGAVALAAVLTWRARWARLLWRDPAFGACLCAAVGYLLFMTYQNHPQPRYYTVVALFSFLLLAMGARALVRSRRGESSRVLVEIDSEAEKPLSPEDARRPASLMRFAAGFAVLATCVVVTCANAIHTGIFAAHPEYTFVRAAQELTRYIDEHPNGRRMLVSISGDQITMMTHLPSLCDDFGTQELPAKLAAYRPGWWATWNDIDPGTLEDLHLHYSIEQVANFRALDDPERNQLVLFKLNPLPAGKVRDYSVENLQAALPGDKIDIPIE